MESAIYLHCVLFLWLNVRDQIPAGANTGTPNAESYHLLFKYRFKVQRLKVQGSRFKVQEMVSGVSVQDSPLPLQDFRCKSQMWDLRCGMCDCGLGNSESMDA